MSAPKPPKPPDPQVTAAAQTASNKDTLQATLAAQMMGQNTPVSNLSYAQSGVDADGNPMYTATSTLSQDQQQLLDTLENSQMGLGGAGLNLVNDVTGMYGQAPDFSEAAGTQTRINMDRQLGYLSPYFTQQTEQLDNQLRNQGLMPGSPAYDRAMRTMRDNQNQSVMSFLNTTQPIAFNQAVQQYNQPLQTISGIMGLTQPVNYATSYLNTPKASLANTDIAGITNSAYQNQLQAYQAQVAQHNALMSGIFGLGTSALTLGMGGGPMMAGLFGGMGGGQGGFI